MSSLSGLDHSVVAFGNFAPPSAAVNWLAPAPLPLASPPTYRLMRPVPASVVNSLSAMPISRRKHSSASAPPVVRAILGMCPSDCVLAAAASG